MHKFLIVLYFSLLNCTAAKAQSNRLSNTNAIGWLAIFGNIKCNSKLSVHAEAQFRAINLAESFQQILLRTGLQYSPNKNLLLRAGYAHAETYAYGSLPINGFGKRFTEHRAFEMLQVNTKVNSTDLQHRFMLEQRWVGRYATALSKKEDKFVYTNRIRYMLRAQKPIGKKQIENNTWYVGGFNEVFISFGKKVGDNVFDQNRTFIYAGYKHSNAYKIEFGLLNQTQQLGRRVEGKAVFHYNTGLYVNNYFSF
jgi:hypothetical protein